MEMDMEKGRNERKVSRGQKFSRNVTISASRPSSLPLRVLYSDVTLLDLWIIKKRRTEEVCL